MEQQYGLLIDYKLCSGCRSCEVACKEEHDYPVGVWGIRVFDDGPWKKAPNAFEGREFNWNKIAVPTDLCDLCARRVQEGRDPVCVHHCLADVMTFGPLDELSEQLKTKPGQVLWVPDYQPLSC